MMDLQNFVLSDDSEFSRPFTVTVGPFWWTCASNRSMLVAIKEKGEFDPWAVAPDRMERLQKFLRVRPENTEKVDVSVLQDWAGDGSVTRVGMCLDVPLNASQLVRLFETYPYPKVNVWNASMVVGVAALGFSWGDKWRAFIGGVTPGTDAFDLDPFDPNPQRTALEALMSGDDP